MSGECYDPIAGVHYPHHDFCPRPGGGRPVCSHCGRREDGSLDPDWSMPIHHTDWWPYPSEAGAERKEEMP